jgi:AraC-like DNA-binding protein/quercetin dioxygenase-like cupin family protein
MTDHRICVAATDVLPEAVEFLSFLAMIADLGLDPGLDGRVVRHAPGGVRPRRHRHAELELNLVVGGTASYLLDQRRYQLSSGSLTWLFPGQEHLLVEQSPDHELWWAVFRPELVARTAPTHTLLEADPVGRFSRRLTPERARDLESVFAELADADAALLNAGLAYLLLVAWRAFLESDDVPASLDLHPAVETVVRLLRADPGHGPLDALARDAGLSPSHLSRLFKTQTGVSISRFRNQQRLERFLLLYGRGRRTTATAAALEAGFGSYTQFHRVFRRETGKSPTALRG